MFNVLSCCTALCRYGVNTRSSDPGIWSRCLTSAQINCDVRFKGQPPVSRIEQHFPSVIIRNEPVLQAGRNCLTIYSKHVCVSHPHQYTISSSTAPNATWTEKNNMTQLIDDSQLKTHRHSHPSPSNHTVWSVRRKQTQCPDL